MYYIPQEYTPDNPYYSRKGRTYYRKHPVVPRNYTKNDLEMVKSFFKHNPIMKKKELWVNISDPSDLTSSVWTDFYTFNYFNDEESDFHISDSLPDPVTNIVILVVQTDSKYYLFPYPISDQISTSPLDIVVHNPTNQKFTLFSVVSTFLQFKDTETSPSPSQVLSITSLDGTPYLINTPAYIIDISQLQLTDSLLTIPK